MNWFRKDADGSFVWPGFGENSRVLAWVIDRVTGVGEAVDTPIGRMPAPGALDLDGLDLDADVVAELFAVDADVVAGRGRPHRGVLRQVRRPRPRRAPHPAGQPPHPPRLRLTFRL